MTLDSLYDFALSFEGRPYIWGGDGSARYQGGIDCSGLVQIILSAAKMDPLGDQTADTLYRYFLENGNLNMPGLGSLAFFGTRERIVHTGWSIDKKIMLNASGGGSHVRTLEQSVEYSAKVRIEKIRRRTDLVALIMPNYASHGII